MLLVLVYLHDDGLRSRALNARIVPEFVESVLKRIDGAKQQVEEDRSTCR